MEALAIAHGRSVQMIDRSIVRVRQHGVGDCSRSLQALWVATAPGDLWIVNRGDVLPY
jgi:hypothetical protein